MKKIIRKSILMTFILICFGFYFSGQKAQASSYTLGDIPLQVVDDINNTPYPSMTKLNYYYYDHVRRTEFTVDTSGELRAIFRIDVHSDSTGRAWISTDSKGQNIVGKVGYFTGTETKISWFLEKGTYYMFTSCGDKSTEEYYYYLVDPIPVSTAILFEKSRTEETSSTTSFINPNRIGLNKIFRGFLSDNSPSDYYSFTLGRKASVTINYSFDTSNASDEDMGYCTLYDENELFLADGTYQSSDRGQNSFTYLLEPGVYYIKMHGLLGKTTLKIDPMYYNISFRETGEEGWTTKAKEIHIDTDIEYSEITVLHKDVKDSLLNNDKFWSQENKDYVPIDGETFTAEDSGIYSVRITDIYGNNSMAKVEVSNIDVTKPKITGVKNNKSYKKSVTIKWSDEQSGIDDSKTTLNGKKVKSGIKVKDEGKYVLKVYDKVGNSRTITFYIDKTAPTTNVTNGKTYKDIVVLRIKDNVSGIKKVVVDNVEEVSVYSPLYFYLDGEYVVEMWDNADNYRKVEFKIKR